VIEALDRIIQDSLTSLFESHGADSWVRREREIVSFYAFGHLLKHVRTDSILNDPAQIGVEVAVPQHLPGDHTKDVVCKDLAIWPTAGMTTWSRDERNHAYPLSILEWKTINWRDGRTTERSKLKQHEGDIEWLVEASKRASEFVGYAVLMNLRPEKERLECARIADGSAKSQWLVLPEE
jgi:hypothetical protein